jgi:Gluconate 2-dehydrogenase subunit 3
MTHRENLLSPEQRATFLAAADRIIPEDDFPSASQAGAEVFILRLLGEDHPEEIGAFLAGLDLLSAEAVARFGQPFAELRPEDRDALLSRVQEHPSEAAREFFRKLVEWIGEGFYADPGNGGNRDAVSWRMIGYDPGIGPEN